MERPLFDPIPVRYLGLYSDDHLIDLQEVGVSFQGLARVSNSIVDFYLYGRVTTPTHYNVRMFAAAPEPGCFLVEIVAMMYGGALPLYAQKACELASEFIIPIFKAVISNRLKRPDNMDKALDTITQMANRNADLAEKMHGGHMTDKAWLQSHIDGWGVCAIVPQK